MNFVILLLLLFSPGYGAIRSLDVDEPLVRVKPAHGSELVVKVKLEDYLRGVLAAEIPMSWPLESLKAQAIAARSFTLSLMEQRRQLKYDVVASVHDQVYAPEKWQKAKPELKKKIEEAIASTRGLVLRFGDHRKIFRAFYHADSGGRTEKASEVWGPSSQPSASVFSPATKTPHLTWQVLMPKSQLLAKLQSRLPKTLSRGSRIESINVASWSMSERVKSVRVQGRSKDQNSFSILLSGNDLRELVGFNRLKSTRFRLTEDGKNYVFNGEGYGHGVGLCQWGAKDLAEQGYGFKQILAHYFPQTWVSANSLVSDFKQQAPLPHEKQKKRWL